MALSGAAAGQRPGDPAGRPEGRKRRRGLAGAWDRPLPRARELSVSASLFIFFFLIIRIVVNNKREGPSRVGPTGPGHPRCHLLCRAGGDAPAQPPRAPPGPGPDAPASRPRPRHCPAAPPPPEARRAPPGRAVNAPNRLAGRDKARRPRPEQAAPEAWASRPGRPPAARGAARGRRRRRLRRRLRRQWRRRGPSSDAAAASPRAHLRRRARPGPEQRRALPRPRRRTPRPRSGRAPLGRWRPSPPRAPRAGLMRPRASSALTAIGPQTHARAPIG